MATNIAKLEAQADWDNLKAAIDPRGKNQAVTNILAAARASGACSAMVEEEYLDQDFSTEFSAFYSKVFRRYTKICQRIHFFSAPLHPIFQANHEPKKISDELTALSDADQYIGFVVIRPIEHAPLGRVVLRAPKGEAGTSAELLIRATYEVHVLGACLKVAGNTYTQQDSRIAACAQAAIWSAARHFHVRHKGPWISTVDVSEAAAKVTDQTLTQSLPAGSGGLSVDNMVRALKEIGRQIIKHSARFAQIWPRRSTLRGGISAAIGRLNGRVSPDPYHEVSF
ncbi:hypothetical protein [Ferrovibrio sp.]|uniref:hypothetical protein n=1 Tax=Ferrovibrio sp. TaxID=1917215 RepID=UPI000CB3B849|nr:hypothetical protein [Ferrovibrio sp.]PJI38764.1 MAG: hypothetical protein CTR53_16055 [Ferrovibrio sp.]